MSLVELADYVPNAILDLRYGTTNNILGEAYPNYPALLEEEVALALREVEIEIGKKSLVLVIWDAFRPQEVHDKLMLKEPNPQNVNPNSPHLWGGAVDLTFAFKKGGQLLDIGVDFDEFGEKAHPNYSKLTAVQRHTRPFIKHTMEKRDCVQWDTECWHFGFKTLLERP